MEQTLFDKTISPRLVYAELAVLVGGADNALFVQQVHFWLSVYVNKNDKQHFRNGRWWIWNSYPQWQEQIPWLSVKVLRRVTSELREMGLILVMKGPGRGTLWYTIDYDKLKELMYEKSDHINTTDPARMGTDPAPQGMVSIRSKGRVTLQRIQKNTHIPDTTHASHETPPEKTRERFHWISR